jgi:hypothetical protein
MRTISALALRFVALILALFAIFATVFVLLFLSFNRIIIDHQTYKHAFTENKVYEQLPEVIAAEFALVRGQLVEPCAEPVMADSCLDSVFNSSTTETGELGIDGIAFINGLNQEQWNNLVMYLLTPEDVQKGLEAGVDEVIAYFKGETDSAGIPLLDLKVQLASITRDELTAMLLNPQPPCTLDQQTLIMSAEHGKVGSAPVFCSVTSGTSEVLVPDLQRRLSSVALELPERVFLIKPPSPSNPRSLQMIIGKDLQATLQKLQINAQYLPLLPVGLLVLVTAFGVRSLRRFLRWWSISIFIGSLFALILGAVLFFLFEQIWLNYVLNDFPPILTSGFGEIIYSVTRSLSRDVSQHLMTQAGIVTLTALGILLISNRVPAPPDPSLPPLAPPGTPGGPVLNPNRKKKW